MNNCSKYIEQMNMYLDGELKGSKISELLEHIERCPNCKKRFEALKIISFQTRQSEINIPQNLHEKIMGNIKTNSMPVKKKLNINFGMNLFAAAAVFVFLLSGMIKGFTSDFLFYNDRATAHQSAKSNDSAAPAAYAATNAGIANSALGADNATLFEAAKQSPLLSDFSADHTDDEFIFMKVYTGGDTLPEFISDYSHVQDQESMLYYVYVDRAECDVFEQKLTDFDFSKATTIENGANIDAEAEFALYIIKLS